MKLGNIGVQIIDGDRGKNYPNEFTKHGYCLFLNAKNVTSTGFAFDNTQFITKERDDLLRKGKLIKNDIVLTTRGTVGNVALYDDSIPYDNVRINSGMVILRSSPQEVNSKYFYYVMKSIEIQKQILQMRTGSAQPQFPISHMVDLEVPLPPLPEQIEIGRTLAALDAKIAANTAINHNLEQMAQAIFAELYGNGNVTKLSEILTVCYGKDHKRLADGTVPCYGSGGIMRYVDTAIYNGESILIPRKGSLNNVLYVNEPFWTVDTMFYTQMTRPNVAKFTYFIMRDFDLAGMNVGSAVPSMTTAVLNDLDILLPSDDALSRFEECVTPMFLQIKTNSADSTRLANLRDTLLPRLMSGEIKILEEK